MLQLLVSVACVCSWHLWASCGRRPGRADHAEAVSVRVDPHRLRSFMISGGSQASSASAFSAAALLGRQAFLAGFFSAGVAAASLLRLDLGVGLGRVLDDDALVGLRGEVGLAPRRRRRSPRPAAERRPRRGSRRRRHRRRRRPRHWPRRVDSGDSTTSRLRRPHRSQRSPRPRALGSRAGLEELALPLGERLGGLLPRSSPGGAG